MNNREAMQKQFEDSNFYTCGESQAERLANWNVWKDAWNACLASQVHQPTKLVFDSELARQFLLENVLPKFSDSTFQKYVLEELAGDFAYQLAMYLQSQAQQTESPWVSVDEAKATLKDGDLIYVVFENGSVSEAVYLLEKGSYPHRVSSHYGNERIEHCTHVMRRKAVPLPPAPEGGDK